MPCRLPRRPSPRPSPKGRGGLFDVLLAGMAAVSFVKEALAIEQAEKIDIVGLVIELEILQHRKIFEQSIIRARPEPVARDKSHQASRNHADNPKRLLSPT